MSPDERTIRYIRQVCRHLFWPPYRIRVRRELTDHIFSRAEYLYSSRGFSWEQAVIRSLQMLGDPDELGKSLRRARFSLPALICLALTGLIWAAITACSVYLLLHLFV